MSIFALYNVNKHSMLRQKQEKSGTGICHVMQGKESKPVPMILRLIKGHHIEQSAQLLPNHIKDNNKRDLLCTK